MKKVGSANTLKEVSKAKHRILERYFPIWATILGSYHHLFYVDCFAGEGVYSHNEPGSPIITFRIANKLANTRNIQITLVYVEKSRHRAKRLGINLTSEGNPAQGVQYHVIAENSKEFTKKLLQVILPSLPAFFFIDPYGHPISIPIIKQILLRPRNEVLLNLMWFSLNRDLNNPKVKEAINKMFGHSEWQKQLFMKMHGKEREEKFLQYFCSQIGAQYYLEFKVRFSPEDKQGDKTKYYLIHFSNRQKAVLLMKQIMWNLGDEEGTFDYSASHQGVLFSRTPLVQELVAYLRKTYIESGQQITFMQLQEETYQLPFIEKHYREAIKQMEAAGEVGVDRIESKKTGIKGKDIIIFG